MSLDTIQQDRSQASATGVPADQISTGADLEELEARFRPIFARIHETARERDRERRLPRTEIDELRRAGFGALRVPKVFGGAGASITQLTGLLTELSAADPNVNQALRGHLAFVEDRLWHHRDTDQSRWFHRFVAGDLVGNAWTEVGDVRVGEVQTRVTRQSDGDYLASGRKYYTTGSIFADWIDLYAQRAEDGVPVIAAVSTHQDGVVIENDWNGFGQRTTGSGTTILQDARVAPEEITVFAERFPYQTAFYQLSHLASQAGIARGAVDELVELVRQRVRVYSHGSSARWHEDPLVLQQVGIADAEAFAARTTAERVGETLQQLYLAHCRGDGAREREFVDAGELDASRGQSVNTKLSLDVATRIFNALGASAASEDLGLDRHWRNARTVSSHNPVIFKERVIGDWLVNGTPLPYAWAIGRERDERGARA